jgi:hypothetical protein
MCLSSTDIEGRTHLEIDDKYMIPLKLILDAGQWIQIHWLSFYPEIGKYKSAPEIALYLYSLTLFTSCGSLSQLL